MPRKLKLKGNMHQSIVVTLVKLKSDKYSIPKDSVGYVDDTCPQGLADWSGVKTLTVGWLESPNGLGGTSSPIHIDDVEFIGRFYVRIPESVERETINRAQLDIPEWKIKEEARLMIGKLLGELSDDSD